MTRTARMLAWSFALALALLASLVGIATAVVHHRAEQEKAAYLTRARSALPAYLHDADLVTARLPPAGTARDAGPFLRPILPGASRGGGGKLTLPSAITELVGAGRGEWAKSTLPPAARALDFGWMRDAMAYDHWAIADDVRAQPQVPWLMGAASLPAFRELIPWVRLRLLEAKDRHELVQADEEVRHLAALLHSTELVVADMIAVGLLRSEAEGLEAFAASGVDVSGTHPWPLEEVDRYRAVVWGGVAYLDARLPEDLVGAVLERGTIAPITCSALNDSVSMVIAHQAVFGDDAVPRALMEALAHPPAPCRLELARRFMGQPRPTRAQAVKGLLFSWAGEEMPPLTRGLIDLLPGIAMEGLEARDLPNAALDRFLERHPKSSPPRP